MIEPRFSSPKCFTEKDIILIASLRKALRCEDVNDEIECCLLLNKLQNYNSHTLNPVHAAYKKASTIFTGVLAITQAIGYRASFLSRGASRFTLAIKMCTPAQVNEIEPSISTVHMAKHERSNTFLLFRRFLCVSPTSLTVKWSQIQNLLFGVDKYI